MRRRLLEFCAVQFSLPLLIIQLVLILAFSRVLHFLLRPLRQPRVISEILVSHKLPGQLAPPIATAQCGC